MNIVEWFLLVTLAGKFQKKETEGNLYLLNNFFSLSMVLLLELELWHTEVYMFKVYCLYNKEQKVPIFCDNRITLWITSAVLLLRSFLKVLLTFLYANVEFVYNLLDYLKLFWKC